MTAAIVGALLGVPLGFVTGNWPTGYLAPLIGREFPLMITGLVIGVVIVFGRAIVLTDRARKTRVAVLTLGGAFCLGFVMAPGASESPVSETPPASPEDECGPWEGWRAARVQTPSGSILVGWDLVDTAKGLRLVSAVWVYREGTCDFTLLSDPSGPQAALVEPWGTGAIIVGSDEAPAFPELARYWVWLTNDGRTWRGPDRIDVGEGIFTATDLIAWRATLVLVGVAASDIITAEEVRYSSQVWTSTDGLAWSRQPTPPEFGDSYILRCWEGGDGLVCGLLMDWGDEWPWTSADLVSWRPQSSPYPCDLFEHGPSWGPYECTPPSAAP